MEARRLTLDQLVHERERLLFWLMAALSLIIYLLIGVTVLSDPATGGVILFYGLLLALLGFLVHGLALGQLRGNGILVSEHQFPLLYQLTTDHARRLGLEKAPAVYVVESGGILNAFATRFFGRTFVIVNADVLAVALRRGEAAVGFIVGHELGHHWRGHLKWRWLIGPARFIPYLGSAYSRICEYTCDRVGAYCQADGAVNGLLVLAAGGWLHPHVNVAEFAAQAQTDQGFWIRRAELVSSHPRLPKRVAALMVYGVPMPAPQPLAAGPSAA